MSEDLDGVTGKYYGDCKVKDEGGISVLPCSHLHLRGRGTGDGVGAYIERNWSEAGCVIWGFQEAAMSESAKDEKLARTVWDRSCELVGLTQSRL